MTQRMTTSNDVAQRSASLATAETLRKQLLTVLAPIHSPPLFVAHPRRLTKPRTPSIHRNGDFLPEFTSTRPSAPSPSPLLRRLRLLRLPPTTTIKTLLRLLLLPLEGHLVSTLPLLPLPPPNPRPAFPTLGGRHPLRRPLLRRPPPP